MSELTITQRVLDYIGTGRRPYTAVELARYVGELPATVSSILHRYAEAGKISREKNANGTWVYGRL